MQCKTALLGSKPGGAKVYVSPHTRNSGGGRSPPLPSQDRRLCRPLHLALCNPPTCRYVTLRRFLCSVPIFISCPGSLNFALTRFRLEPICARSASRAHVRTRLDESRAAAGVKSKFIPLAINAHRKGS